MKIPKLDYPVHTLDKRLFLPAGKLLASEALDELIATNKGTSYKTLPFLEYGTVYQDILRLLQNPPYHVIFDELKSKIVLNIMKKISFIPPILESLDYFKENDFYTYRHSLMVFAMSTIMARDLLEK
ncbi:MAG: hypothetical protein O2U61_06505, partial [Candidatus Bathyarchaeota archaeon]|nr:hypothetical protein [Candidatus Bathyarchaeota archaeon]